MDKITEDWFESFINSHSQVFSDDDITKSYGYLKGFYDATYNFMQTFNKLIEAGAFNGTKSNTNN